MYRNWTLLFYAMVLYNQLGLIAGSYLSIRYMWRTGPPLYAYTKLTGWWKDDISLGPIEINRHILREDSTTYSTLTIMGAQPLSDPMGRYYIQYSTGETVWVDWDADRKQLDVPLKDEQYSTVRGWSTVLLILVNAVMFYCIIRLYKFVSAGERRDFFPKGNVKLLRRIGLILLIIGIIQYLLSFYLAEIIGVLLGIHGIRMKALNGFPYLDTIAMAGIGVIMISRWLLRGERLEEEYVPV